MTGDLLAIPLQDENTLVFGEEEMHRGTLNARGERRSRIPEDGGLVIGVASRRAREDQPAYHETEHAEKARSPTDALARPEHSTRPERVTTTFESRVLRRRDGLVYSIATPAQRDQIVRILSESFRREPMSSALGASASDLAPLTELFMPECTTNGLSVVAVPEDDPQTVAGVFISRDFKSPLPDGVPDRFPWFLPIAEALGSVDAAYEAQRPELALGDAVDLWMVGVAAPKFVGRGIANTLFELCTDLARERGFGRCVTECTGHYSQSAARRAGFAEVARLAYRDFRFEGRPVFADVPSPHTHLVLYEKKL